MKAKLIDIGRGKVNKVIEVKTVKELHKEIDKHVASKGWGMEETIQENMYEVTAGFRTIGHVQILEP